MNFSFWPFLWFGLPGRLLMPICDTLGGVCATFLQEEGMLLQKYGNRNGRCTAMLSKVSGSGVDLAFLNYSDAKKKGCMASHLEDSFLYSGGGGTGAFEKFTAETRAKTELLGGGESDFRSLAVSPRCQKRGVNFKAGSRHDRHRHNRRNHLNRQSRLLVLNFAG